jgi:subtilase family serine protease
LKTLEVKPFGVPMIVRQVTTVAHGLHYMVFAKVDPQNLILENNEDNNVPSGHVFESKTPLCQ